MACFDEGITPGLTPLVVPVGPGQSVVALSMTTERAPYVVNRQAEQGPFEREVPWRDGNRTRSAHRDELLRLLAVAVPPPDATVVQLELGAKHRAAETGPAWAAKPERIELTYRASLFFGPPSGPVAVLPAHLMGGQVDLAPDRPAHPVRQPVSLSVAFSLPFPLRAAAGTGGKIDPHPLGADVRAGDVYLTGPGTLEASGSGDVPVRLRDDLLTSKRLGIKLNLPVAGGERPVVVSARLDWAEQHRDELARWVAV
jgi:hypothetical protein